MSRGRILAREPDFIASISIIRSSFVVAPAEIAGRGSTRPQIEATIMEEAMRKCLPTRRIGNTRAGAAAHKLKKHEQIACGIGHQCWIGSGTITAVVIVATLVYARTKQRS